MMKVRKTLDTTVSFPRLVFPCRFKGLAGFGMCHRGIEFLPCKSTVCPAIRISGDVAEWSKALPC